MYIYSKDIIKEKLFEDPVLGNITKKYVLIAMKWAKTSMKHRK